jgi:hypothetical protein
LNNLELAQNADGRQSLATVIINTWFLVSSKKSPSLYNPIVVLLLQCLLFIWWLATWADLITWTVAFAYSDGCYVGRCVKKRTIIFSWDSYRDSVAAATGASILNLSVNYRELCGDTPSNC